MKHIIANGKRTKCGLNVIKINKVKGVTFNTYSDSCLSTDIVHAALASDCDACRTAASVCLVNEKQWDGKVAGIRPEPVWDQKPMKDAEEICASARRNRG